MFVCELELQACLNPDPSLSGPPMIVKHVSDVVPEKVADFRRWYLSKAEPGHALSVRHVEVAGIVPPHTHHTEETIFYIEGRARPRRTEGDPSQTRNDARNSSGNSSQLYSGRNRTASVRPLHRKPGPKSNDKQPEQTQTESPPSAAPLTTPSPQA